MENQAYVFIDEYGTPALNVESSGVEPYFIYVSVLINGTQLENARLTLQKIRDKYNQGAPLKANKIPNDDKGHNKRLNILKCFSNAFTHVVHALIVSKEKLNSPGFSFKKSFIKYFNGVFTKQYKSPCYSEVHVILDKTGRPTFQHELEKYMNEYLPPEDLFSRNTFNIKDDKVEEPLLQIADFYAGCIGRIFCEKIRETQARELYNLLRKYTFCECFPREQMNYLCARHNKEEQYDERLMNIAIQSATSYLDSKDATYTGRMIVNYFLTENCFYPFEIISSARIKRLLEQKGIRVRDPFDEIARLRDSGVLIVSPLNQKGYKLPCNIEEVKGFYERVGVNVLPQLRRVYKLNELIVSGTLGGINPLQDHEALRKLVETITPIYEKHCCS